MTMAPKEELTMTTHDTDAALPADAADLHFARQAGEAGARPFIGNRWHPGSAGQTIGPVNPAERKDTAMGYGHAERNLALIRQLEAETRELLGSR
jgi:hypothetical protein